MSRQWAPFSGLTVTWAISGQSNSKLVSATLVVNRDMTEKELIKIADNLLGVLKIPVIFSTGVGPEEFRRKVERCGANLTEYLEKHFSAETLGGIVSLMAAEPFNGSVWRNTPSKECSSASDFWTAEDLYRPFYGQLLLAIQARAVLYAAMYDIYATHGALLAEVGQAHPISYRPPSALRKYVRNTRLGALRHYIAA